VEYTEKRFDGDLVEIDVTEKGKLALRFISNLHEQMVLIAQDKIQTVANLVYWLDRTIPHQEIPPAETGPFLTALVHRLVAERGFNLSQLFRGQVYPQTEGN